MPIRIGSRISGITVPADRDELADDRERDSALGVA
jgi:hypothetical protein